MMGDHAIYHEGWIASTKVIRPPWDVAGPVNQDPFNNVHLGTLRPDQGLDAVRTTWRPSIRRRSKELKELFLKEAEKYQVLPLDASVATRLVAPRPNITAGRSEFVYTQAADRHPAGRLAAAAEHAPTPSRPTSRCRKAAPKACC